MTTRRLAMTCWLVGVFSCTWGSASFTSLIRRHNFVGIHIFHSGKPRRNFLIQISSKIYLTLKEKGSEARKVCMIRYFFLFLDEMRRRGGGVLPPSNSLWSSFPVGDVTTCSAWDTTWSYSLHSDALCLSKTLSYSLVVSYKDSVSHLKW